MKILGLSQRPIELIAAICINGNAKLRQTCYCLYQALALNQTSHLSDYETGYKLRNASCKGYEKVVVTILRERSNLVNCHDNNKYGWTSLLWASANGHKSTVKLLLDHGADVNLKNNNGGTALIRASRRGHESAVKLLLEYGADVNLRNKYDDTPLIYASRHETIAKLLKANGATS